MIIDIIYEFNNILDKLYNKYEWFNLPTPKGSITNTELLYIYGFIKTNSPRMLFESGVGNGRSTVILAECMREFGDMISAKFAYPDDRWDLPIFEQDFPHLIIKEGRGEQIIQYIDKYIDIAVIDGPKPNGAEYDRPGWVKLIKIAKNKVGILFQHDISNFKHKQKFENMNLNPQYINNDFLSIYHCYGTDEIWQQTTTNLGYYIINDSAYSTPWA